MLHSHGNDKPDSPRNITICDWFDNYAITAEFFNITANYVIVGRP
jgi:hypothetical protein